MDKLDFHFEYEWQPFTVAGRHLNFKEHRETRLLEGECSHWGAVIYKWEGILTKGEYTGRRGILIGETDNLRQRIKQYARGTQKNGNAYWRREFLLNGYIQLYVLKLYNVTFRAKSTKVLEPQDFSSSNRRLVYEQLLVMNEVLLNCAEVWLVNRKL